MTAVKEKVVIVWGSDDGWCFNEGAILIGAVKDLHWVTNRRDPVVDVHLLQHDWRWLVWWRDVGTGACIQTGAIAEIIVSISARYVMYQSLWNFSHLVD